MKDGRIEDKKYAMNQEEKRGLIRTAGRGEGQKFTSPEAGFGKNSAASSSLYRRGTKRKRWPGL